jgi:hypothetical protein
VNSLYEAVTTKHMCAACLASVLEGVEVIVEVVSDEVPPDGVVLVNERSGETWVFPPRKKISVGSIPMDDWYPLVFVVMPFSRIYLGKVEVYPLVTTMFNGTIYCPTHLKAEFDIERMRDGL